MATKVAIPKIRVIAIAASGGTAVTISASIFCRYMEITECPPSTFDNGAHPYAPQGLVYTRADETPIAYTTKYGLIPGDTLAFGDKQFARDRAIGQPGWTDPAGTANPATPFVKLVSATATTTQVQVSEWP